MHKDYPAAHAVIGDAALILDALIGAVKKISAGKKRTQDDVVAKVAAIRKEWLDEWMPQLTSDETPINQYRIIWDLLHNVEAANTIITHDAGSPRDQIVPFWECTVPRTYMGWGKSTQLGYGLGLVMGAKLAEPDKLCVNIMGDAAIGMTGMDIETAARNRIGILTIVFNNGIMAIEQMAMPYANKEFDANLVGGNYTQVAAGLGAWSKRVETPDAFVPALKEEVAATKKGQPALIECITKAGYDFSRYP